MPRFRKKPVEVEAMQFTGTPPDATNADEVLEWMGHPVATSVLVYTDERVIMIPTLEGPMTAKPGDWIIRGVQGELYPCKPDIFEATYESADVEPEPLLGLATTRHLLDELRARIEVDGRLEYRTVDA